MADEPAVVLVGQLLAVCSGRALFAERSLGKLARERFVTVEEVVREDPEVVLASWCGKPFERAAFERRPGFGRLSAVRSGRIHEIPSELILQPGPACLTDGLDALRHALKD